jgi:hypothetical protein
MQYKNSFKSKAINGPTPGRQHSAAMSLVGVYWAPAGELLGVATGDADR